MIYLGYPTSRDGNVRSLGRAGFWFMIQSDYIGSLSKISNVVIPGSTPGVPANFITSEW